MHNAMAARIFLVDDPKHASAFAGLKATVVSTPQEVAREYRRHWRQSVWVAPRATSAGSLAAVIAGGLGDRRLLLLEKISPARRELLRARFRLVVEADDSLHLLPREELVEVLASPERRDLIIGGIVDQDDAALVLYRGDLEPLVVPLAWFVAAEHGPQPDPDDFEIIDFGQTIRLGKYEAAVDALLYTHDPDYRRRAKARRLLKDDSFGASIRRLRLERGLSRADFPGITSKEVARIERNEIRRPHAATLKRLAKKLGLASEELKSY